MGPLIVWILSQEQIVSYVIKMDPRSKSGMTPQGLLRNKLFFMPGLPPVPHACVRKNDTFKTARPGWILALILLAGIER